MTGNCKIIEILLNYYLKDILICVGMVTIFIGMFLLDQNPGLKMLEFHPTISMT